MNNLESILKTIKRLYTKIFLITLHNRIHHYHASQDSEYHLEISEALHQVIDETIKDISQNTTNEVDTALTYSYQDKHINSSSSKVDTNEPTTNSMTLDGLSLYFKKNKALELDPSMAARLRRCTWDHVHTVHRLARAGDHKTARLHITIASNAMKTLSHYMLEDEYNEFYKIIAAQINNKPS